MTDQEKLAELRNRINEAAEVVTLMPVNTNLGGQNMTAGKFVPGIAAAMPVPLWDAILIALDAE